MHTSNIHEIRKKAAVSIAVKIITGHLLRTVCYNISNIENRGLEGVGIIKRATGSSNGFTNANSMPRKKAPTSVVDGGHRTANGVNPMSTPTSCFTIANPMPRKRKPPLTSPAPRANGGKMMLLFVTLTLQINHYA